MWSATDRCGNQNTGSICSQFITIVDDVAPEISCPDDLTLECGQEGNEQEIQDWLDSATASDECNIVLIDNDYSSLAFTDGCSEGTGMQVVTFIATDLCGNTASCTAKITLVDNTPPVVDCPDDLTLECANTANEALITAWRASVTGTDDCGSVTFEDDYTSIANGCEEMVCCDLHRY